jgi:hypothetical protein
MKADYEKMNLQRLNKTHHQQLFQKKFSLNDFFKQRNSFALK